MGIKVLDERHKRFAEMMLSGKPRTMKERAAELSVDRNTLYTWAKDQLWQKYYDKLAEDVHAERVHRLVPLVLSACDALGAALDNAVDDLRSQDGDRMKRAPSLSTLAGVTKQLVELERVDQGKPSRISKTERTNDSPTEKASAKLLQKLDELFETEGEDSVSEVKAAPAKLEAVH